MESILLIDDDSPTRHSLRRLIQKNSHSDVKEAADGEAGLKALQKETFELVITDMYMPRMNGLQFLTLCKERYPNLPIIVMTSTDEISVAIEAMKLGASDFLVKPIEPERLTVSIRQATTLGRLKKELDTYKRKEIGAFAFSDMVGHDRGLKHFVSVAKKVAQSDMPVLIHGETGTGKELAARAIHGESVRVSQPFIAVNCAAIPKDLVESTLFGHEKGAFTGAIKQSLGKFREAEGGTLFLDEIGELPMEVQSKLLRALQEKEVEPVGAGHSVPVDVRIISATHRDLPEQVKKKCFREDLLFRLNVLPLTLPPLRERTEDISTLVNHFLQRAALQNGYDPYEISTDAMTLLASHAWPGNVRELENAMHRLAVMCDSDVISEKDIQRLLANETSVTCDMFSSYVHATLSLRKASGELCSLVEMEVHAIRYAMQEHRGNVTRAAKSLGLSKPTLYRKLASMNSGA